MRIRPGIISPKTAQFLNRLIARVEAFLAQQPENTSQSLLSFTGGWDNGDKGENDDILNGQSFKAEITDGPDDNGFYAWKEVVADDQTTEPAARDWLGNLQGLRSGSNEDSISSGQQVLNPAYEANGLKALVGDIVNLRLAYFAIEYDWVYEFDSPRGQGEFWCKADTTTATSSHYDGKLYHWDPDSDTVEFIADTWMHMLNGTPPILNLYYACSVEEKITISSSERFESVVADHTDFIVGEENNSTVVSQLRILNVLKTTGLYLDDAGSNQGDLGMFTITSADGTVGINYNSTTQTIDLSALCCREPVKWWCVLQEDASGSGAGGSCPCPEDSWTLTVSGATLPELNGEHTLTWAGSTGGSPCLWQGSVTVSGDTWLWQLYLDGDAWLLTLSTSGFQMLATWRELVESFDCCSSNSMTLQASLGFTPGEVTVEQTCASGSGSGSGGGGSETVCVQGTAAEAADRGIIVGGPYDTYAECSAACEDDSGGSGEGGGPGETECCPDDEVSGELLATFSLKTGEYSSMQSTATLTYHSGLGFWIAPMDDMECCNSLPSGTNYITLHCNSGVWSMSGAATCFGSTVLVSDDCDPFEVVFDYEQEDLDGVCGGTFRVTVTEAP